MKTNLQRLAILILILVSRYDVNSQIKSSSELSNGSVIDKPATGNDIIRDTVPYAWPDSLIPKRLIPDDNTFRKPQITKDTTKGGCNRSLENRCITSHGSRPPVYCPNGRWFYTVYFFEIYCYRTILLNGQEVCVSTNWYTNYTKSNPLSCYASQKMANSDDADIEQEEKTHSISGISPNPIQDNANFTLHLADNSDKVQIKIMDINGRMVDELYQENLPKGDVSVTTSFGHLTNGVYLAALYVNGDYISSSKIIIAH